MKKTYDEAQVTELLYQALETEMGGILIYEHAIQCAVNEDLKKEWTTYLNETLHHKEVLLGVFEELGLDPKTETPGRAVVRHIGESLVIAMEKAMRGATTGAAQLVARPPGGAPPGPPPPGAAPAPGVVVRSMAAVSAMVYPLATSPLIVAN